MVVRNTFLIVLFAAFLSHGIIAQNIDDVNAATTQPQISTTTPPQPLPTTTTICPKSDEFPLFGPGSCVSRTTYTGIFLTSIILAGISFLMLIGLLILYFIRRAGRSGSSYSTDDEGSISGVSNAGTSVSDSPPPKRKTGQKSDMLKKESPATPTSSSAPYTAAKPVSNPSRTRQPAAQYANVSQKPSGSYEMPTRPSSKPPTNTPRQASSPPVAAASRGGKSSAKNPVTTDNDTTSQF